MGRLLDKLAPYEESLEYDSDEASLIRVVRRDWEKARRVPAELRAEMSRAASLAMPVWVKARQESDFSQFLPALRHNFELRRRYVECFDDYDEPYDVLLDDFEPGMKTAEVRDGLRPAEAGAGAARRGRPRRRRAARPRRARFPLEGQKEFELKVIRRFGFDPSEWRLDTAVHPFAASIATTDIRLTTRYFEDNLDGLFGTMHECGHGLYEHGVARELERTPLARGASLGLHESQSRMWENMVGRSLPFWRYFYPQLQRTFPDALGSVALEDWYRSVNWVEPSLIRVEADEATYNLHIILRFELEQELLADTIDLEELPEIWNERMQRVPRRRAARRRARRAPGHALGDRRDRLLLDLRARQRHLGAAVGAGDRRDPRPARPVRAGRVRRARRLAAARTSGATAASSRRASSSSGSPAAGSTRSRTCATCAASTRSRPRLAAANETGERMAIRVGINGFGRIGRNFFRAQLERGGDIEIVAANDLGDAGDDGAPAQVRLEPRAARRATSSSATASSAPAARRSSCSPSAIPARSRGATSASTSCSSRPASSPKRDGAQKHLDAGAKKVVISAPATDPDVTIVLGVNDDTYDKDSHHIVSNASCTTNCVAPMAKVLHDAFTVEQGFMTTIHAYTNDQRILDLPHKDLRRARAAAINLIPTSTGAARAIGLVLPELKGKVDGMSMRAPVPTGSVTDLVVRVGRETTRGRGEGRVPRGRRRGRSRATSSTPRTRSSRPTSSSSPYSCIFDSELTMVNGSMVKVFGWYDNEWGYCVPARRPDRQAALMKRRARSATPTSPARRCSSAPT